MIRWTTTTTNKGKNYDVSISNRLPVAFTPNRRSVGTVRPTVAQRDKRLLGLLGQSVAYWTKITFTLVAIALLCALSNLATGEAQETQAGSRSAWMGPKMGGAR